MSMKRIMSNNQAAESEVEETVLEEQIRPQSLIAVDPDYNNVNLPRSSTPNATLTRESLTPTSMSLISRPLLTGAISSPVRVPGTYPPEWLPDHETEACMACESPFTLIRRRHHCRSCGKIFCSDCCKQKAKLLYLDNNEARVCNNCCNLIEFTLSHCNLNNSRAQDEISQQGNNQHSQPSDQPQPSSSTAGETNSQVNPRARSAASTTLKVHGVLKTSNQLARLNGDPNDSCNMSNSSSSDQHSHKQVIFSDGIRPGTDLSEPSPYVVSSQSSGESQSNASFSILSRQNLAPNETQGPAQLSQTEPSCSPKKSRGSRSHLRNITVCDELGYLPPIVISLDSPIARSEYNDDVNTNSLTSLIINQFKTSKKTIQASMESRSCPLNGIVKFEEICSLVGVNNVVTFVLLKSFYLKAKIVKKECCINRKIPTIVSDLEEQNTSETDPGKEQQEKEKIIIDQPEYWCFTSSGLEKLGQDEIMFVIDKDATNSCIPRDIFKIYLTLHELALRRQAIENLGNLLFQDGLFGSRDTAGLLFVKPSVDHCLENLIVPSKNFLIALILQRWEVPWSKVFPMRLLLRLGYKYETYPYPIVSYRIRDPVYYEIGHTIISILADFRNFRYSLTHVDGLKVMLNKTARKVTIQLHQSNYMQFSKVLDSSNNEHVLAWSSCAFPEADGHLVSIQNDEGQYETVEFYKKSSNHSISFKSLNSGPVLGASFIVFSGALKLNQSGQPAKISIVEDGLLIQIQSCTMSALRNAVRYMDNFDIDCENAEDPLNRVEIRWQTTEA